jgi:hypothetical protein
MIAGVDGSARWAQYREEFLGKLVSEVQLELICSARPWRFHGNETHERNKLNPSPGLRSSHQFIPRSNCVYPTVT